MESCCTHVSSYERWWLWWHLVWMWFLFRFWFVGYSKDLCVCVFCVWWGEKQGIFCVVFVVVFRSHKYITI